MYVERYATKGLRSKKTTPLDLKGGQEKKVANYLSLAFTTDGGPKS